MRNSKTLTETLKKSLQKLKEAKPKQTDPRKDAMEYFRLLFQCDEKAAQQKCGGCEGCAFYEQYNSQRKQGI